MDYLYEIEDIGLIEFQLKNVLDRQYYNCQQVEYLLNESVLQASSPEAETIIKNLDIESMLASSEFMPSVDSETYSFGSYPLPQNQ